MIRSAFASLADRANRRPTWVERNGSRFVEVCGYSPIENLVYGAIAAAVILAPVALFLVSSS